MLAYFQAKSGDGVLAPHGWHCFGTYGSGGATLYISPEPIDSKSVFSSWDRSGPGIAIRRSYGETSGRFDVAAIIARVFPAHREFIKEVLEPMDLPLNQFPFGPYPADKLNYKRPEIVEFQTPPQSDGLGTHVGLLKNASPIRGVAMLVGQ